MARVLVTGSTGFLGGVLIRHLRARGFEVIAIGRNIERCRRLEEAGFRTCAIDLSAGFDRQFAEQVGTVDAVVHCAALSAPWGPLAAFRAANVNGTRNALDLAEALKACRFVNISSPTVYFELKDRLGVRETDPLPPPANAYARTKREAEAIVLGRPDLSPINLRPRGIYGAGEQALLPRLLAAARKRPLPLLRNGVAAIDLTHVDDVVAAIEAAVIADRSLEGETFNISGGEVIAVREIVGRVCAEVAQPMRWRRMPLFPTLAMARLLELASRLHPFSREPLVTPYTLGLFAFRQSLDIAKARNLLNWEPKISFEAGLALTFSQRPAA